jgi:hypothetical protein
MIIKIRCFYIQKKGNNCFLTNFLSRISLERKWFGLYETRLLREKEEDRWDYFGATKWLYKKRGNEKEPEKYTVMQILFAYKKRRMSTLQFTYFYIFFKDVCTFCSSYFLDLVLKYSCNSKLHLDLNQSHTKNGAASVKVLV